MIKIKNHIPDNKEEKREKLKNQKVDSWFKDIRD